MKENEWQEVGQLSQKIRNDLLELKDKSQELKMTKKEVHSIIRAISYLDQYRSDAENRMFKNGIRDLTIFYSGEKR